MKRFLLLLLCLTMLAPHVYAQHKELSKTERIEVDKKGDRYLVTTTVSERVERVKVVESAVSGKSVPVGRECYTFKPKADITVAELVEIIRVILSEANVDSIDREALDSLPKESRRHFADTPEDAEIIEGEKESEP
jgi:hypothetical protein